MPGELPSPEQREVQPKVESYAAFLTRRLEASLPRNSAEGTVGQWFWSFASENSPLRNLAATQETELAGNDVRVEKKGPEIARIIDSSGQSVEGYDVKRTYPDGKSFEWHQPGIRRDRRILTLPTETGVRQQREASSVTVIVRDTQTGEVLLMPKQELFAQGPKNILIKTGAEAELGEVENVLNGNREDSEIGQLLNTVNERDSIADMVRNKTVEFFAAPPTDANRTTDKPLAMIINIGEGPDRENIRQALASGEGKRWCSKEDIKDLYPALDGQTAATLFAAAAANLQEYEYVGAKRWFDERLNRVGSQEVKHAETVTNGNQWKVAQSGEVDEGVDGGHFKLRRFTTTKELPDGTTVTEEKVGMVQTESPFSFPTQEDGDVSLNTSGVVGPVMSSDGRILLSVEPEPFVIDPGLSGTEQVKTYSSEQRGLLKPMQFSTQKLQEIIEGKNVDPALADLFAQVVPAPEPGQEKMTVQEMFKKGLFEISVLPPADASVIKATNLQITLKVRKEVEDVLVRDGTRRWFTMREAIAMTREGKINALTAAALLDKVL